VGGSTSGRKTSNIAAVALLYIPQFVFDMPYQDQLAAERTSPPLSSYCTETALPRRLPPLHYSLLLGWPTRGHKRGGAFWKIWAREVQTRTHCYVTSLHIALSTTTTKQPTSRRRAAHG